MTDINEVIEIGHALSRVVDEALNVQGKVINLATTMNAVAETAPMHRHSTSTYDSGCKLCAEQDIADDSTVLNNFMEGLLTEREAGHELLVRALERYEANK